MRKYGAYAAGVLFVGLMLLFYFWDAPIAFLTEVVQANQKTSALAFIAMLFLATVFAPLTVMPLVPVVAPVFGPFLTGVYSLIGWTLGAVVAFFISRKFGRPVVAHFADISALDRMAARIPERTHFFIMVLMRMSIPADVLSYALGLVKGIKFLPYLAATILGVAFFSFAFAYLGEAFFESEWFVLLSLGAVSVVLFSLCWFILLRHLRVTKKEGGQGDSASDIKGAKTSGDKGANENT